MMLVVDKVFDSFDTDGSGLLCYHELILRVRRENIVQDTLQQLVHFDGSSADELKKELKVIFVGEEGVDEGGVQKEFMHVVTREVRARARRGTVRTRDE